MVLSHVEKSELSKKYKCNVVVVGPFEDSVIAFAKYKFTIICSSKIFITLNRFNSLWMTVG